MKREQKAPEIGKRSYVVVSQKNLRGFSCAVLLLPWRCSTQCAACMPQTAKENTGKLPLTSAPVLSMQNPPTPKPRNAQDFNHERSHTKDGEVGEDKVHPSLFSSSSSSFLHPFSILSAKHHIPFPTPWDVLANRNAGKAVIMFIDKTLGSKKWLQIL
ncbi:hypothetical protein AOLI_G00321470 [Acnodon oligacanthus]